MGTDDFFKKRKAAIKKRKNEERIPLPNSYLIVSEGEKTEPLYFDGMKAYIEQKYGSSFSVEKPIIKTCGEGRCTVSLVEATRRIISKSHAIYSCVWIVFDKDDFTDFDEAIQLAHEYDYNVAWSNQSFEYWLFLHFNYSDAALHRDDWERKLSEIFMRRGINPDGYKKNDEEIFKIVTTHGSLKYAVHNAIRIESNYSNRNPSQCDPCTKVQHLILELKPYISELLE